MTTKTCKIILVVSVLVLPGTASAISPFKKAFDQKYVEKCDNDDFTAAFKKTGCYSCHVKGEKKDWLNAYGLELAKLVPGNVKERLDEAKKKGADERTAEDEKVIQELQAAFNKVGKLKSPSGELYEELFVAHKLPTPEGAKSTKGPADSE